MKTRIIKVPSSSQSPHRTPHSSQGGRKEEEENSIFGRWAVPPTSNQTSDPDSESSLRQSPLNTWEIPPLTESNSEEVLNPLQEAALYLRESDIPVAFPTETVYGLGADATRSAAVRGIYKAKGRPSDNPLIVHVADLDMLRCLLSPPSSPRSNQEDSDPIPKIYRPVIRRFWPGPLTILLPNPSSTTSSTAPSENVEDKTIMRLAPEVTATLPTFGARMPASSLARSLIKLTGRPLAAPSANASTKPSPTTARHVLDDLSGKIELILDGGPCQVGVESTVVDGLCSPPVILRPGGVSIEQLRTVPGWEGVEKAYKDHAELGATKNVPRAPGMKYKHYSPVARVVLYENPSCPSSGNLGGHMGTNTAEPGETETSGVAVTWIGKHDLEAALGLTPRNTNFPGDEEKKPIPTIAIIRTTRWPVAAGLKDAGLAVFDDETTATTNGGISTSDDTETETETPFTVSEGHLVSPGLDSNSDQLTASSPDGKDKRQGVMAKILDVNLGKDVRDVAHGLFAALRELDRRGADIIFVEGVGGSNHDDDGNDHGIAAAVMNRLRKAASEIRT